MIVADIKSDAKQVLGFCDDATLYNRITHAIETLANKGQWDAMTAYMDIAVTSGNVVTLPREVEMPIRLNINKNPAFTRSKLYEFSLNGPGNDMQDTVGYSWMDHGEIPVLQQPPAPSQLTVANLNVLDNGKQMTLWGYDNNNQEIMETFTLLVGGALSGKTYKQITHVSKPVTTGYVQITDLASTPNLIANYYPDETEPFYRQIRLSKAAAAIRMLFRRRTYEIKSDQDWIPLQSRMAILMMLKALEAYRNGSTEQVQKGAAFEALALKFVKEEQDSRNNFDLIANTEITPTLDLNYNNSDSIIVADIYDDVASLLGPIGRGNIFDKITEGVEMLNNKGQWDGLVGWVDLLTDNYQYITLPRYVEAPIAININGTPKMMRNKWFEFHLNGPGSESSYCKAWDYIGDVVTIRPLPTIMQFIARPDMSVDDNKTVTIFGYDENQRWIRTQVGGVWQDGFQVVLDHTGALPATNAQKCSRIERITRDATTGFVQLVGYDSTRQVSVQMGYYYPDETEPNYVRIRLPMQSVWVRMRYRKRTLKVQSLTDPLHLKNKLSILEAVRSLKALSDGKFDEATAHENKAVQFLIEEQSSRNPSETFDLQIIDNSTSCVII